jgi:hypothetical protein
VRQTVARDVTQYRKLRSGWGVHLRRTLHEDGATLIPVLLGRARLGVARHRDSGLSQPLAWWAQVSLPAYDEVELSGRSGSGCAAGTDVEPVAGAQEQGQARSRQGSRLEGQASRRGGLEAGRATGTGRAELEWAEQAWDMMSQGRGYEAPAVPITWPGPFVRSCIQYRGAAAFLRFHLRCALYLLSIPAHGSSNCLKWLEMYSDGR